VAEGAGQRACDAPPTAGRLIAFGDRGRAVAARPRAGRAYGRKVIDRLENPVKPRHLAVSLVVLAAVGGPIAGCGGSNPTADAAQSGTPAQHAKSSGSSRSKPSGGSGSVTIANFKFAPASLSVSAGTRITVANHDSTAHTATADNGNSFETGDIDPGSSATIALSKRGTYKYHCSIHPFMHGTLVVK
jgi:plastocyanin